MKTRNFLNVTLFLLSTIIIIVGDSAHALIKNQSNMIVRKADERGSTNLPWFKSSLTFSFDDYQDPKYNGFHALNAINEDLLKGSAGFDKHPHENMEIITYVIKGSLEYEDTTGHKGVIGAGEIQRMNAGSGIEHSVYNHEKDKETHFYQIWIIPQKKNVKPSYGQKSFDTELKHNKFVLVISNTGHDNSLRIGQDVDFYLARPHKGASLQFKPRINRHAWVQMVKGRMTVNGTEISTGDGLAINDVGLLEFKALDESEFMLFDLS